MDKIKGTVDRVIDSNTFVMNVTWQDPANKYGYEASERIQLSGDKSPEPGPVGGTYITNAYLLSPGSRVHCNVQARDTYGRVVSDVWKY